MKEKARISGPVSTDKFLDERHLLRTLMDTIPDTIYFKDRENRFILINKAQAGFLGIADPDNAIGKTDFDFFLSDTASETTRDEQELMSRDRPMVNKEEKIAFPDGHSKWVSATKVPIHGPGGEIAGIVGISRDITEHKLMEDRLQQEHNLLHTLIDNMPDFIYVKDRQSRFLLNNNAHQKLLGVGSVEEVAGKSDFDFFPQGYAQKYFEDEQEIMSGGSPLINIEEASTSKVGGKFWLSTTKIPLRNFEGDVIGIVGISRDISERKRQEEEIRKAKDELENRVLERTADLKLANVRIAVRLNQLNFLNRTSYDLAQLIKEEDLYPAVVDAFVSRFGRAEACLCTRGENGFVCRHATPGLNSPRARSNCEKALAGHEDRELQTPILVEDWTEDRILKRFSWPSMKDLKCHITIPLLADNRMISCLQIFTTFESSEHYEREKPLLTTLAAHAAVCQSNARNYRELGARARLEGELEAARNIQHGYMPKEKPPIPHVNVKGVYFPAFEVGGDYLDYFPTEDGLWVLVVADVCGKGIPAALHMTVLRAAFRSESQHRNSPREIMCAVNEAMRIHLDQKSFITALCLVIGKDGSSMKYSRAGHPLLMKIGVGGQPAVNIPCNGVALGLISDAAMFENHIEEVDIPLVKGDRYLVYTDGVSEAINKEKENYGLKRLCSALENEKNDSPDKIVSAIMHDVGKFRQEIPFHDDVTILAMSVV
jgi:PAS domain S-box-containing protein